jgi:DNA-binding transcriptional LysR family regulator
MTNRLFFISYKLKLWIDQAILACCGPNEADMKPRQLEVFHAIMASSSLTKAARVLGISQPAVSATLKQMEDDLALRLFDRAGGRLVPTQEAELLFPEVERVFLRLQVIRRITKGIRDGSFGFLSVIATPTLADTIVPSAFYRLRERHPGTRLRLETASARQVADRVIRREFDIGLIYGPNPDTGTSPEPLGQTMVACAMRDDNPLAALPAITPHDLDGESIVTFPKGAPIRDRTDEAFRAAGIELTTSAEVTYSLTACVLVHEGTDIAIIDPLIASTRAFPNLVIRPFKPAVPIDVLLLSPNNRPRSRLGDAMVHELHATFDDMIAH